MVSGCVHSNEAYRLLLEFTLEKVGIRIINWLRSQWLTYKKLLRNIHFIACQDNRSQPMAKIFSPMSSPSCGLSNHMSRLSYKIWLIMSGFILHRVIWLYICWENVIVTSYPKQNSVETCPMYLREFTFDIKIQNKAESQYSIVLPLIILLVLCKYPGTESRLELR